MPGSDGVVSGWKFGEFEASVVAGDGKKGSLEDREVALHPRMDVAFDGDEFFTLVGVGKRRRTRRLDLVPLAIDFGERMDVVGERVAVRDFHLLAGAKGQHVRSVMAINLVKDDGRGWNAGGWRSSRGDIDNDVAQRVVGSRENGFRK